MNAQRQRIPLSQQKTGVEILLKWVREDMRTRVPEAQRNLIIAQAERAAETLAWLDLHSETVRKAVKEASGPLSPLDLDKGARP